MKNIRILEFPVLLSKECWEKPRILGIIIIYETERKNGSQSSNLYIFNRFPQSELPKEEKLTHLNKTINLSKTKNQENNKRNEEAIELEHTYTSDHVPQPFVQLVRTFIPTAKSIEEYWRMTVIAAYRNNREKETDTILSVAMHSIKQLVRKIKAQRITKPIAYYYGILDKKFTELYFEELYDMWDNVTPGTSTH